ncbi:hypothetical protein P3G55_13050 [Leptospira sp. 96542]|nr:hypothetical protein [Leptospira sp. 96542]
MKKYQSKKLLTIFFLSTFLMKCSGTNDVIPEKKNNKSIRDTNLLIAGTLININNNTYRCPEANQILRKNNDYQISLEIGKPYYFNYYYLDNAKPPEEVRNYYLKVTKTLGTTLLYKRSRSCSSLVPPFVTINPTNVLDTELTFTLNYSEDFRRSWEVPNVYSIELTSGDPNITIRQE